MLSTFGSYSLVTAGAYDQSSLVEKGLDGASATPNPPSLGERLNLAPPPAGSSALAPVLHRPLAVDGELDPRRGLRFAYQHTDEYLCTYSGSDLTVLLEVAGSSQRAKVLLELVTISVSVHREKDPVRALGYTNPKAFSRGRRTIGGTLVLTQFNVDVLYRFLGMAIKDVSKDTYSSKADQLPPFNLTLLFADEFGHASQRRLLGCDLLTDGTVYSSNDMFSEQTITYMAADFTPLLPLGASAAVNTTAAPGVAAPAKTPKDLVRSRREALGNRNSVSGSDPVGDLPVGDFPTPSLDSLFV